MADPLNDVRDTHNNNHHDVLMPERRFVLTPPAAIAKSEYERRGTGVS
jgi:hypothetical protein